MRATVRYIHSPDVRDLAGYQPEDPELFAVLLQVMAGPSVGQGVESFEVVVCSPLWLQSHLSDGEIRWLRHHLVVRRFDWAALDRFIRDQFESVEAETWSAVAQLLGRFGKWEFEDYSA